VSSSATCSHHHRFQHHHQRRVCRAVPSAHTTAASNATVSGSVCFGQRHVLTTPPLLTPPSPQLSGSEWASKDVLSTRRGRKPASWLRARRRHVSRSCEQAPRHGRKSLNGISGRTHFRRRAHFMDRRAEPCGRPELL
jgi:hypothetical protein